jgi:hypothetical protein
MIIIITILIAFSVGFVTGFLINIKRQVKIQDKYYSVIKTVIHEYIKTADRINDNKYIIPKNKIELLTAKITLAIKNIK